MSQTKIIKGSWYFLLVTVIGYIIVSFFSLNSALSAITFSLSVLLKIIPIFVLVFIIMVILNYFIPGKVLNNYLNKTVGFKKWLIAIIGGIISAGPIYMWFPLLKELKEKGASYGFIAAFLYSKAIKPALIPLMILYFGLKYTLILIAMIIVMSLIQGKLFEQLQGGDIL